ncbi:nuclear pore complex protein Nup155, partial [Paragonimus westermani]
SPTSTDKTNEGSNPPCLSRGQPPVVLTQHLDPPYRRLLLISAQGLIHLRLANPLVRLKEFLMREASSSALNTSLNATGLIDQYSGNPTRLGTQSSLAYPSFVDLDDSVADVALNTRFLSAYLHQFSPDEAICAALVIGAASSVDGRGIHAHVEQAVLYFAAEASQFWIPAVRRATPGLQQGQRQQALSTDRSLSSGLFLFSGLSVFFARLARTFWRSPLFRDASRVSAKASASSELVSSGGFRSWMHTFVHVLASASPLRAGRTQQDAKQPIISRLDPDEISWLAHQVGFLQQFLRRQLNVRGGWLRASTTGLTPRPGTIVSQSHTTDDGDEYVDVVLLQRLAEELDKLLSAVLEVLGFWRIFSEHIVHKVVERLPGDQRALLLQFPFEVYVISLLDALFPSGLQSPPGLTVPGPPAQMLHHGPVLAGNLGATELITALINALIDYYLAEASQAVDSGVSLDTITSRLQCACPTLFANEDAMCAKASECLIQVNLLRAGMTSSDVNGTLDSSSVEQQQQPVSQSSAEIERLVLHALQLYTEAGPGLDLDGATERLIASGAWSGAVALCLSVAKQRDPTDVAVDCLKNGRRPSTEPLISDVKSDRWGRKPIFAQSELAATEGRYDAYHQLIKCIDRLWELTRLPAGATDVLNQPTGHSGSLATTELAELNLTPPAARSLLQILLQDVIQSTDILAHFEILGWLLSRGLTDTAVSLNSPHLEAYLRSRLRQSPDDPDLRCLLWRHLEKRGARLEAAQVLEHLAVTPCRQLTLEARLDFAARAIVTVKAMPAAQQDLDYLHDLESRLELGQLQQQLYLELCNVLQSNTMTLLSSPSARSRSSRVRPPLVTENELHEAVFQLSHGPLLSLSEMFTDYADKFGLHESKLILLWAADSQDIALIKAIWRDLLHQLLSFGTSFPVRQMDTRGSRHSPPMRGTAATSGRRHGADNDRQRLIELALTECLSRLGHRFSVDGAEIVCILEYYAIQHKLPQAWVPTVLRDTRLSCSSSILDAYDTLLHSKDSFWRLADVRSRLFVAFVTVIEDFLGTVSMQLPMRQRMLQVGHILDRVTGNLVDLSAESTKSVADLDADVGKGEVHRTRVIERLRRVHDQLQRYHR